MIKEVDDKSVQVFKNKVINLKKRGQQQKKFFSSSPNKITGNK